MKKILALLMALTVLLCLSGCAVSQENLAAGEALVEEALEILEDVPEAAEETRAYAEETEPAAEETAPYLDPYGSYTTKEDVALYIHLYGELPLNFMTKKHARALGWAGGSLEPVAPGMCIGGDYFGNYGSRYGQQIRWTQANGPHRPSGPRHH